MQLFRHFKRTPTGSIADTSVYCVVILIMSYCDGFLQLGLKTGGDGFLVWASKPCGLRFVDCATKPMEGGRRRTRVEI
jgi:hypothetical protein